MIRPANMTDAIIWSLCILCSVSLQTQITLFASETYLGLRINLTDIIAPIAGVAILFTLLKKSSEWPEWRIPYFYVWLAGLTAILVAAFLYGWVLYDEMSRWAIVNKLGGWVILLAILGMAGWLGRNAHQKQIELLLRCFLYFFLAIVIGNTIQYMGMALNAALSTFMSGLMANRNSYAFLFVAALSISTCFYFSNNRLMPAAYSYALFFVMPFFLILNGSRASWICIGILLLAMLALHHRQIKKCAMLFLFAALGTACMHGIYSFKGKEVAVLNPRVMGVFQGSPEDYGGDQIRIAVLKVAVPMIQERPVLGSGLGSIMMEQQQKNGELINLLDSTPLWLLTETGLIGLVAFAFFYFLIVRRLFQNMKEDDEFSKTLRVSVLFLIAGFSIMCLFHEFMYTRFLWFFLGLALAVPARMRQAV